MVFLATSVTASFFTSWIGCLISLLQAVQVVEDQPNLATSIQTPQVQVTIILPFGSADVLARLIASHHGQVDL